MSVVIPVHNGSRFLAACIENIRNQVSEEIEIIVVDDGSTDASVEIAKRMAVSVVIQQNAGVCTARNRGFLQSTGEFIVFQDQDDLLVDGSLQRARRMLMEQPGLGMTFGRARIIDEHGESQGEQSVRTAPPTVEAFLAGRVIVPPGIAMFRRTSVIEAGPFDPRWQIVGDLAFYVSIMKVSGACHHDEISVAYRRHGDNVSGRGSEAETLRELLAYLGEERLATRDPRRLQAIRSGRRYWIRRFWRGSATWAIRSVARGRFREAIASGRTAAATLPARCFGRHREDDFR